MSNGADLAHRWATGQGVKVAVVGTGVDTKHPDLHGRIIRTINFVEGGERTFARDSHGIAVAGVIAATADNEVGIFGIAPQADIVVVKACWQPAPGTQEAVCSSWTLAKAIDFTILVRAQILNLSLAGPPDPLLARFLANSGGWWHHGRRGRPGGGGAGARLSGVAGGGDRRRGQ